jgi:molybdopterin-guanine dinucleotide biosynthesis protein MobB
MPVAIAVVGGKKSGKTTTIEILTRELTQRGYKIAAVKHIPEPNFTIDREGKDTWRYVKSGAKTVVGVSTGEIATIEKKESANISLNDILCRRGNDDVVFFEGFRDLVARNKTIYKIVVVRSAEEGEEDLEMFDPILAFTGPCEFKSSEKRIPYVDLKKNPEKLADLVEKIVIKKAAA